MPTRGAEGNETEELVELDLADGAGNHGEVVPAVDGMLDERGDEPLGDAGVAELLLDGEQADFAQRPVRGEVGIEVVELAVERERALVAKGDHTGEDSFFLMNADDVGVLLVEFIGQHLVAVGFVLRDFLHEGFIVQRMDSLDFPRLFRDLEDESIEQTHLCLLGG